MRGVSLHFLRCLLLAGISGIGLAACFGDRQASCSKPEEYQASRSAPPLKVPPDLEQIRSPSLEIPDLALNDRPIADSPCLEEPPDYFAK